MRQEKGWDKDYSDSELHIKEVSKMIKLPRYEIILSAPRSRINSSI